MIHSTSSNYDQTLPDTTERVPRQNLNQEDFLQLLSVQLANQDPTQPVESTEFIAQMAQFSALEQSTTLARDMAQIRADSRLEVANSFIGREVSFENEEGELTSGVVSAVQPADGDVNLEIDGQFIPLSAVVRVAPPETLTTTEP